MIYYEECTILINNMDHLPTQFCNFLSTFCVQDYHVNIQEQELFKTNNILAKIKQVNTAWSKVKSIGQWGLHYNNH